MNEQLINGIYNNCLSLVLMNTDESLHEKLSVAYKKYLVYNYADTLEPDEDINLAISIYTKMEQRKWVDQTLQDKLSILIDDENLDKLRKISGIGQKHAERKLASIMTGHEYTPDLTQEQVEGYIHQMEELHDKVRPYNLNQADMYLSEGILDFNFSMNKDERMSFRLSRLK